MTRDDDDVPKGACQLERPPDSAREISPRRASALTVRWRQHRVVPFPEDERVVMQARVRDDCTADDRDDQALGGHGKLASIVLSLSEFRAPLRRPPRIRA